jgi:tetratricopeptide (TPR) repeat protein
MSPSVSPPSVSPFPGEAQSPPAIGSSLPSKKEESESDEYLEIATLYAQKGKYQKAEELFQKVAKENPASAKAHNNLGVVRLKQAKYDMAEREFKEAMRIDPAFVLPYYNLACLYSRKGVDVDALIYLKRALKRDERVKQWVKTDKDFDRLRSDTVFQELLGGGSPVKKEGVKTTGVGGTQKPAERVQSPDSVPLKEGSVKKEETSKQEMQTQEITQNPGLQKQEKIPPQSGPRQQVIPRHEEIQQQETPPAGAQNQEGTKGSAQQGAQGGAPLRPLGGTAQ